ncbi:MAG: hypothetical protein H0X49_11900 [Acidobacteria bacterium]|nr:hypothetical protein [Acidobacteriota bacterium]
MRSLKMDSTGISLLRPLDEPQALKVFNERKLRAVFAGVDFAPHESARRGRFFLDGGDCKVSKWSCRQ